jgi:asparagine synthase (glutamine-hydrolysing)
VTEPDFYGHIDLQAADSQQLTLAGISAIRAPGVDLRVGSGITLALEGSRFAMAAGRPRFPDARGAGRDDALRWLALWRERGAETAAHVRGTFAVALVDVAARVALLATDRFAIQPICYAFDGRFLSFSDRADSVLATSPEAIHRQALYDYLYFHVIPAPRTIFPNVSRLRAGHTLSVESGRAKLHRHWTPAFREATRTPVPELADEFKRLLRESVGREATGARVGSFLSGGTDSSTIAGLIAQVGLGPARTFSIGFDAAGYDELAFARIAARHFGTDHHEYYVTPRDLIAEIPRVAEHYDQPFGNSSALAAYCCAKRAREAGVELMLAGDGGDELFGGNTRYARQAIFATYDQVPRWLRSGLLEPALFRVPGVDRLPIIRKLVSFIRQARIPMPERMETYNLLLRIGITDVLEPDFIESIVPQDPCEQQRAVYAEIEDASLVNRMLAYDWKYALADNDLPKVVETAKLAGVAVRFPFLSDELVDFSLLLAPELKLKGTKLRYFFKEALRGFLPDEIITKQKHGFGLPFGVWLMKDRDLRDFAAESIEYLKGHGIVRDAFLRSLLDVRIAEHPGYFGEIVWVLMMLSFWLRTRSSAKTATMAAVAG